MGGKMRKRKKKKLLDIKTKKKECVGVQVSVFDCFHRFSIYEFIIIIFERVDSNGPFESEQLNGMKFDELFDDCFLWLPVKNCFTW